jgi:two-component system sensor kinase FixL
MEGARLRTELMHVSRVATLGGLVAAITQELTQPISAVGMNAETVLAMLEMPQPDRKKLKGLIASIVEDNERSAAIIKSLRPLFQPGPNAKSEFDVDAALKDVAKILKTDAQSRGIRFAVDIHRPLPRISGDRVQIQQAILNLLLNAFDAVAETNGTFRQVVLEAAGESNDRVKIMVRDSGKGIEAKLLDKIFEPFVTTKTTGMGMGLSITRSVIEAHGGQISVSSQPGRSTEFKIDLPCTGIALPLVDSLVAS